jgi:phage gpG-like protein
MTNKFNFKTVDDKSKQFKKDIPNKLNQQALKFFRDSFSKSGWTDDSYSPWQKRKRNYPHKILLKSGDLKRSIHNTVKTFEKIVIISDMPYSAIHNEGLMGRAFGKYSFKMPKRQFMGDSTTLRKEQQKLVLDTFAKIFN